MYKSTLLLLLALPLALPAGTLTWNFDGSNSSFSDGASAPFADTTNALTVNATAWSLSSSGGTFSTARIQTFSGNGMGVCNDSEAPGCNAPQHQVDNSGAIDYVLFVFNALVDPLQIRLNVTDNSLPDSDVEYYLGTFLGSPNLAGLTLATLPAGFGGVNIDAPGGNNGDRTVDIAGNSLVNALLIGARSTSSNDGFKLKYMTANYTPSNDSTVPEPSTYLLISSGLVGLGLLRRRAARQ